MRGKRLVYFDNGASSLTPRSVIDAVCEYYETIGANIHRGVYELSERGSLRYDRAREAVAGFIGADSGNHVIFCSGATHASNMVAYGWGLRHLQPGDEIVISELEHHAIFVPWQMVAEERGAVLRFIPFDRERCALDLEGLSEIIGEKTKVVAVSAMSNVTGEIVPLEPIIARARRFGALTVVDGAQLVAHRRVNVAEIGCDFLLFSGHKMLGPTGIGVLYGRGDALEEMEPLIYGGDMIAKVRKERTTFKPLPDRLEPGTPNIAGVLGLHAAIDYLQSLGMENVERHETELMRYAVERARAAPDLTLYSPDDSMPRGGILSFNIACAHPHDVGTVLDDEGIAVRAGHHCSQPLMQILGIPGTVRASFYLYNTEAEIDHLFTALDRVRSIFGR